MKGVALTVKELEVIRVNEKKHRVKRNKFRQQVFDMKQSGYFQRFLKKLTVVSTMNAKCR